MRLSSISAFCLALSGCAGRDVPTTVLAPPTAATPAASIAEPEVFDYRLSPVFDGDALVALQVELRFSADPSGVTTLHLPDRWASETELWKNLRGLRIDGARAVTELEPAIREINADPGAPIVVRYQVVSAYDHEPTSEDGQPFAPIIRPTWFYVFGQALFATPDGRDAAVASFRWERPAAVFGFVSDLEQFGLSGGNVAAIHESIVLGGTDVAVGTTSVRGAQIRVGARGKFPFDHADFIDMTAEIIAAERDFWGEHGEAFTVALAPLVAVPGHRSLGGTGLSDAFTILMSEDAPLEPLRHLIAHEYFHTWNPRRLGGQGDDQDQDQGPEDMSGKWFSEGFTEYYTWRLLLRAGLFSLEDFVAAWNAALLEYATSPVRNEPQARVQADYWTNPDVGRLPYRRGPLLAAVWNERLLRTTVGSRDLDDVLKRMRKIVAAAPENQQLPDAATLFVQTYTELGGPPLDEDVRRFVGDGEDIILPPTAFGDCVRVTTHDRPTFDAGLDSAATRAAGNVVTGLRRDTPAYRAGLRNGMKILNRVEGVRGDAAERYTLEVDDGGRKRTVSFFPRGKDTIQVQTLVLIDMEDADARIRCREALSGGADISS